MNRKPGLVIGLFSVLVGIFITLQVKTKIDGYIPATLTSLEDTKMEIDIIKSEIEEMENLIKSKEEELEVLHHISKGNDEDIIKLLEEDIQKNKMKAGEVDLKGPGIIISMYDNPEKRDMDSGYDLNNDVIHDVDILNILNDLRIAGAEAISINNERVISTSEVFCGGPIIKINDRSSGTPFVIKAIGDPKLLSASVNAPDTYGDMLKNGLNKGFDTSVEDSIIIPGYNRINKYKYAKPLEGDE